MDQIIYKKRDDFRDSVSKRIKTLVNRKGGKVVLPDLPLTVCALTDDGPLQMPVRSLSLDADGRVSLEVTLADATETLPLDRVFLDNLTDILGLLLELPADEKKDIAAIPDPFILVELSGLCYNNLYKVVQNSVAVQEELIHTAKKLTAKYALTDWDKTDFLETMEDEAERLVKDFRSIHGQDAEGDGDGQDAEPATTDRVVYVGRWDLLPDEGSRIETVEGWTREEAAKEVLRQRGILHSEQFARYGDYKAENIVDSFTPEQFEALFNGDLDNSVNTEDFWVKIF